MLSCAVVLAGALVPTAFGVTGQAWSGFKYGLLASGLLAAGSGLSVLLWWVLARRRRPVEIFRLFLGLGVLCWGTGQVCLAFDSFDHVVGYPAPGDMISTGAGPLCLLAMIFLPRRSASSWPGIRLGLDAVVVGCGLTFVLWRVLLAPSGGLLETQKFGTAVFVLADCVTFAGVLLMAVRDVRSRIWPAVLGVLCHVSADLSVILHAERDGARVDPWWAMALWCLAWPLIAVTIVRFRASSRFGGENLQDRREATATQVATMATYFCLLATVLLSGDFTATDAATRGTLLLCVVIVPVMWGREMLGTHLRVRLTAGLRAQADQDSLTGLPNRLALTNRIAELEPGDDNWVVLTLDLDGFKQVNDLLGSAAGDDLLVTVGQALSANVPARALIARIGSDEFALLSPGDLSDGQELGERLRLAVGSALNVKAPGLGVSASVGVGRLVRPSPDGEPGPEAGAGVGQPNHHDQLTGLVESAAALRAAKEGGRNAVVVYTGEVAQARERRFVLERRLRLAIERREVVTFGQPIVDLASGRLTGFESLARWTDDELGAVRPDEFIAVAEETGMVVELGAHLLEETLGAAGAAGVFAAGLTLSINASPIQLRVPGFADILRQQLARRRIPPELVIVEITEAILVAEGDAALAALAELHALGVGLAIDDFGTGYSALGYLRRFPVSIIKIDKSLTSSLLTEPKTMAIVEGVVRMAHRMGVRVTMEGIEDDVEADSCRAIGADRGQGWLFGRPLSWPKAAELIADLPPAQPTEVEQAWREISAEN
jgi:diguanylate cyclase (GGDEF)-like protein